MSHKQQTNVTHTAAKDYHNTPEQIEALMAFYNMSDTQFDSLGAFAVHALWKAMNNTNH